MKIHLVSDQHLGMGDYPTYTTPSCDVIVCAGDVGIIEDPNQLQEYFKTLTDTGAEVIWVLGNHEFYGSDIISGQQEAQDIANLCNVHLLNNTSIAINGIKFWGSTFWTDIKENDWFAKRSIRDGLNDYVAIRIGDRPIIPDITIAENLKARQLIEWDSDVIITHTSPTVLPTRRYELSNITYAFCNTGLEDKIMDSNIKLWLYGHTHEPRVDDLNKTLLVNNGFGYYEDKDFNPSLVLEI